VRGTVRRSAEEEEGESVFISMTDMTVSFLFIVMILLAFFASQFQPDEEQETVARVVYDRVETQRDTARERVRTLQAELEVARAEVASLRAERDRLGRELAAQQERANALAAQVRTLENALAEARAKAERDAERIAELDRALAAAEQERDAAEAEVVRLTAAVEERNAQIAALEAEIARLREALARALKVDPLEAYNAAVSETRTDLLRRLREAIREDFPNLEVEISRQSDALRFKGEGLFDTGSARLRPERQPVIRAIAEKLDEVLPCYTLGPRQAFDVSCNPSYAVLEAVQIEGHTDSQGTDEVNIRLSAARGAETFVEMIGDVPGLLDHRNLEDHPVLSVAGYGESRPVATNESDAGRSQNRRIDLRFIMVTPPSVARIEAIRAALDGLLGTEGESAR
jgi:chemotaxis protein MotB